jgi:hypothetical protein
MLSFSHIWFSFFDVVHMSICMLVVLINKIALAVNPEDQCYFFQRYIMERHIGFIEEKAKKTKYNTRWHRRQEHNPTITRTTRTCYGITLAPSTYPLGLRHLETTQRDTTPQLCFSANLPDHLRRWRSGSFEDYIIPIFLEAPAY